MKIVLDEGAVLNEVVVTGIGRKRHSKRKRRKDEKAEMGMSTPTIPVPVQEIEQATTVVFQIDIPYNISDQLLFT